MTVRFPQILRGRPSRATYGSTCRACGDEVYANGHAIKLAGGVYHAGCVLYRPRPQPAGPPATGARLRATR